MVEQRNDSRAAVLGGGVSHPSQLTTGLVIKSVTTSPTLAGERMLFILQVSILSEQKKLLYLAENWAGTERVNLARVPTLIWTAGCAIKTNVVM